MSEYSTGPNLCTVEGCSNRTRYRDYCMKHRYRARRYGSPHITGQNPPAELLGAIQINDQGAALELEAGLHDELTKQGRRIQGEWFRLSRADVSSLLRAARRNSHRTTGGGDATDDVPIFSSLAYAAENILPISSYQGI